jgi:hypothetical protein
MSAPGDIKQYRADLEDALRVRLARRERILAEACAHLEEEAAFGPLRLRGGRNSPRRLTQKREAAPMQEQEEQPRSKANVRSHMRA